MSLGSRAARDVPMPGGRMTVLHEVCVRHDEPMGRLEAEQARVSARRLFRAEWPALPSESRDRKFRAFPHH